MTRPIFARRRPHTHNRPFFPCRACGAKWPCQPARLVLLHIYRDDRQGLRLHLARTMVTALADQPRSDALALAVQFLDLLATGDRAGTDAALEAFAIGYEAGFPTLPTAPSGSTDGKVGRGT